MLVNLMLRYCISFALGCMIGSSAAVVHPDELVALSVVDWESTDPELEAAGLRE
jgi:hypothetical protein